jgi:hypothetical protein
LINSCVRIYPSTINAKGLVSKRLKKQWGYRSLEPSFFVPHACAHMPTYSLLRTAKYFFAHGGPEKKIKLVDMTFRVGEETFLGVRE